MEETTLIYLERDGKYLMLHRIKKEHDINHGKWIGIGGHLEAGESAEECIRRETLEETGFVLGRIEKLGVVDFHYDEVYERVHVFHSSDFTGEQIECNEGVTQWTPVREVLNLNLWEGDRLFLPKVMEGKNGWGMELVYEGDALISAKDMEI